MKRRCWRGSLGKVIVVTSGKGGVGKTTSTAALGAALARTGSTVVVVDFDVGLRNLDLVMGAERRVVFDLRRSICFPPRRPATKMRSLKAASRVSSRNCARNSIG